MGNEQLKHNKHDLEWSEQNSMLGRFLACYCNDCDEFLGTLNINYILDHMELGD